MATKKGRFNLSRLDGRITEKFKTYGNFSAATGYSRSFISRVMHGHTILDSSDLVAWSTALEIPDDKIGYYFLQSEEE